MELLLDLLCLCLLCLTGKRLCDENEPKYITMKEGTDVMLPCSLSTKENVESKVFDWRKVAQKDDGLKEVFMYEKGFHYNNGRPGQSEEFKGRVSHFEDELKHGNASIIIRNMKEADSGDYTCHFPRLHQMFHLKLVVDDGVLLQCEVRGAVPKPRVEWQDRDGNKLPAEDPQVSERGDRYHITLQTTVTKTGSCRCVVTQEETNRRTHAEIYVAIIDNNMSIWTYMDLYGAGTLAVLAVVFLLHENRNNKKK
ncbi:butyrophilin subfamily 2 member A1-like isoform X2 [Perca fluviatilis]|uniref:butyrophilin subfamily 2 member A1-like isoform X2 n=1 Tax=Perca fluviatilis TaxID=8168 RepID=UPI001962E297|nr:butyrophilin subfamily 2 member A1-like isoform X2 [Perca fluviatilis]